MNWLWAFWQPGQRGKPVVLWCTQIRRRADQLGEVVFPAECGHGYESGLRQCVQTQGLLPAELWGPGNGVLSAGL